MTKDKYLKTAAFPYLYHKFIVRCVNSNPVRECDIIGRNVEDLVY